MKNNDFEYVRSGRNLLINIGIEMEKQREAGLRHKPAYVPPVPIKITAKQLNLDLDV